MSSIPPDSPRPPLSESAAKFVHPSKKPKISSLNSSFTEPSSFTEKIVRVFRSFSCSSGSSGSLSSTASSESTTPRITTPSPSKGSANLYNAYQWYEYHCKESNITPVSKANFRTRSAQTVAREYTKAIKEGRSIEKLSVEFKQYPRTQQALHDTIESPKRREKLMRELSELEPNQDYGEELLPPEVESSWPN